MNLRSTFREELVSLIPSLELHELEALEMAVQVAIKMRRQGALSTDADEVFSREEDGPALHDEARGFLEDPVQDLTLADQALLASLILSDAYQQDSFSSRAINDVIVESGRPRVAHITSAIAGLKGRAYLREDDKSISLTREGRAKARALIGMLKRRPAA